MIPIRAVGGHPGGAAHGSTKSILLYLDLSTPKLFNNSSSVIFLKGELKLPY